MSGQQTTWRKKPAVIEAMQFLQWNQTRTREIRDWADGAVTPHEGDPVQERPSYLVVKTLEGEMVASHLDWIIKDVKGEFYLCKPDVFEATYELARPDEKRLAWVSCPVCRQPDMRQDTDEEGNVLIHCTNHACLSNGGGYLTPDEAAVREAEARLTIEAVANDLGTLQRRLRALLPDDKEGK